MSAFSIERVRADFPQLKRRIHEQPLTYLDSANTALKPAAVIEATDQFYRLHNANVHRAVHTLGAEATERYEGARDRMKALLNAADRREIVLTRGTTEAINLVAWSFARPLLKPGDQILLTEMEHHANIVPWQLVAAQTGAEIVVAPILDDGTLDLTALRERLTARVKLFAFTHVSNALGTVNPAAELCQLARKRGIATLIDGSQAVPHQAVDVRAIGCDFYAFTGHKLYGPTATGALYGRRERLAAMPPFLGGGEMIDVVRFDGTTFAEPPLRFEAGTPNIAGFAGLSAAIDYVQALGFDAIGAHEARVSERLAESLAGVPGLRVIGDAHERIGVYSFVIDGAHAHDLATILDHYGIALRSGHHCAHPLMARMGVSATLRASLGLYSNDADVDGLIDGLGHAVKMLK
jgi:cysteine desulfurase / selenocysteine lyase